MTRALWVPERQDIIWINFSPKVGREMREMRDMHPMLVLSPKAFNDKTSIVIGFPMSTAAYNATNPFAIDNSKSAKQASYILCNQPKSFDWRQRGATPHPWKRVSDAIFHSARLELNDIIELVNP
jgi:mRNA interferase MazF